MPVELRKSARLDGVREMSVQSASGSRVECFASLADLSRGRPKSYDRRLIEMRCNQIYASLRSRSAWHGSVRNAAMGVPRTLDGGNVTGTARVPFGQFGGGRVTRSKRYRPLLLSTRGTTVIVTQSWGTEGRAGLETAFLKRGMPRSPKNSREPAPRTMPPCPTPKQRNI